MSKRQERINKKELEEHRKLGVVAPQEDKNGFYINPHIPSYMSEAPCYINDGPGLYHQRLELLHKKKKDSISNEKKIKKGLIKEKKRLKKWVWGSCENCG